MSDNKLSYLSKYMNGSDEKKKKKKKKEKKRKKESITAVRDVDADVMDLPPPIDEEEDQVGDEDAPVVVVDNSAVGEIVKHEARGSWEIASDLQNESHHRDQRHDSDNTSDKGAPTRHKHKSSRRRQRHDSSSEDDQYREKKGSIEISRRLRRVKRHDSSSDEDENPRRRTRHDSSSSSDVDKPRRQRHDSSDDEDANNPQRRSRHDSSSSSVSSGDRNSRRRRRHDSSSEESNSNNPPQRQEIKSRHIKHESSSEDDEDKNVKRRNRHDSSSSDDESKARMSSGHVAGLQSSSKFSTKEAKIQQKRKHEAQSMVDKYGMGETVYRDSDGRKVDEPADKNSSKKRHKLTEEEQRLLNTGKAQMEMAEQQKKEFEYIQQSSFARFADDDRLEEMRKNEIRVEDPMAAYAMKRQQKSIAENSSNRPQKPVYKGPPAKPNRFGILPGHRWDAKDRGNGFEDKLLAKQYSAQHEREKAYRYSSADM